MASNYSISDRGSHLELTMRIRSYGDIEEIADAAGIRKLAEERDISVKVTKEHLSNDERTLLYFLTAESSRIYIDRRDTHDEKWFGIVGLKDALEWVDGRGYHLPEEIVRRRKSEEE